MYGGCTVPDFFTSASLGDDAKEIRTAGGPRSTSKRFVKPRAGEEFFAPGTGPGCVRKSEIWP